MELPKHPTQPTYLDQHGTERFRENKIVQYLLGNSSLDLNDIARLDFDDEERCQFAQLIGYSVGGYCDLPYVSRVEKDYVEALSRNKEKSPDKVKIETLEAEILILKQEIKDMLETLRPPVAKIFNIHPDDLIDTPL